jgi:signal transduction histidine kinase
MIAMSSDSPNIIPNVPLGDLLSLGAQLRSDSTPDVLLQEVADSIHRATGCPHVYVRLRHPDTDVMEAVSFVGLPEALVTHLRAHPARPAQYQQLLQPRFRVGGNAFFVPDSDNDYDQEIAHALGSNAHTFEHTSMLVVPLRGSSEHVLGLIYIAVPASLRALILPNIQVLEAIAHQAGLALENARLADRNARLFAREQLLTHLGRDVSASLDLETIMWHTLVRLHETFQHSSMTLLYSQAEPAYAALLDEQKHVCFVLLDEETRHIVSRVAWRGVPYFPNAGQDNYHVDAEQQVVPGYEGAAGPHRSLLMVPIWSRGQVIGTLNVGHERPDSFSLGDVDLLETIAAQIGGPVTSARLYQESRHLAEQVQRHADQLTVLMSLARIATATLNLKHMFAQVTEHIRHGFGYNHVELYLLEESTHELVLYAQTDCDPDTMPARRQPVTLGIMGRAVRTGQTQQVDDVRQDSEYYQGLTTTRAELCVPIVAGGRVIGLINLEADRVAAFTGADVALLGTAADILAGAIENARLNRRAQEAAVLEERNRLARELHDSVTQQLFSITLTAQAARAHLEKNPQRTAGQLERLQETAAAALTEMRALIAQLRPPALSHQGLVSALQQHVATLSRREGLRIELSVTGNERYAQGFEQTLYRIAQEALNNVIKHAAASGARVALDFSVQHVTMRVIDDGRGFDTQAPLPAGDPHFGLISMRERAAEIGGTMRLHSTPGEGTELVVTVLRGSDGKD